MKEFNLEELKNLYIPPEASHKGQNGKMLVIGGSTLFHAASLWALSIASKIVDMAFYASVPVNNQIVLEAKKEFRNGIVVPRVDIENYIEESDCILIGPGMVRKDSRFKIQDLRIKNISQIDKVKDEGAQTYLLTEYLLHTYPEKKWVIDAGALQMMHAKWLLDVPNAIITPHPGEFERLFSLEATPDSVAQMATMYKTTILLKGHVDIVCSPAGECVVVSGGNAGMSKGGTGDVLAGLTASLFCKNDAFLSAKAASFFNKKAGESLFERVGYYFNASDLIEEIPKVMKHFLLK